MHIRQWVFCSGWLFPSLLTAGNTNALPSESAQVTLREGTVLNGPARILDGQLSVTTGVGQDRRLELKDVRQIRFGTPEPTVEELWQRGDIGRATLPGMVKIAGEKLTISGAGEGISHGNDSFYFVHRPLERSGEIVVCVRDWQEVKPTAKAGVMFRDGLDPSARNIFLAITPAGRLMWQMRARSGINAQLLAQKEAKPPVWLKLAREGGIFIAYFSADGQKWEKMAQYPVSLPDKLLAGFAFATGNTQHLAQVTAEQLAVRQTSPVEFKPRLRLVTGTEIPAAIFFADDTIFKFVRGEKDEFTVPRRQLARICYQPLTAEMEAALRPGRAGVLLFNGDFVDGELKKLAPDMVTISSVLFGLKSFKLGAQAVALVLQADSGERLPVEIRLQDGSVIRAREAMLKGDQLRVSEPILGEIVVPLAEWREFKRAD